VDLRHGYASFDETEEPRARKLFAAEGLRLRRCRDVFDNGEVIAGLPLSVDLRKAAAA
jgi:hypothetical protein